MLPPFPPSPPDGPPRGTYFSRRNATQPFPPFPAFTKIFASSTNTSCSKPPKKKNAVQLGQTAERNECDPFDCHLIRGGLGLLRRMNADEPPVTAAVLKLHHSSHQREQRVVAPPPDILACLMLRAALPD